MTVSVLIPTYQRVSDLDHCLKALREQERKADEVLVVVRSTDEESRAFMAEKKYPDLPIRLVFVEVAGQVAALNAGVAEVRSEIVAITDDDTAPHPDWLLRIAKHFAEDACLGGLGGRDWICEKGGRDERQRQPVGLVRYCGRVIGNHHLGYGEAREVDVLKGANMSYRTSIVKTIQFDRRLKGSGAQVHNDMAISLNIKSVGWKNVYDPKVAVDHHIAPKYGEEQRLAFCPTTTYNAVFNETLTLLEYLPPLRRTLFLIWAALMGSGVAPGALQAIRLFCARNATAKQRIKATYRGRIDGLHAYRNISKA